MRAPHVMLALAYLTVLVDSLILTPPFRSVALPRASSPLLVERGDTVLILADVNATGGVPAKGMVGEVIDNLEESDAENWGACCEPGWGEPTLKVLLRKPIRGYFEHSELKRLTKRKSQDLLEGDRVAIVDSVIVKGMDALGKEGTVVDVWTGCEVDPACCCNELATAAVQVDLDPPPISDVATSSASPAVEQWTGMFHKDEVMVVRPASQQPTVAVA